EGRLARRALLPSFLATVPLAFGRDQFDDGGDHLRGEPSDVVSRVAAEDVAADALGEGELSQLLDPCLGRALQKALCPAGAVAGEPTVDVVQPPDVGGAPAGLLRRVVDAGVHR